MLIGKKIIVRFELKIRQYSMLTRNLVRYRLYNQSLK